MIVLPEMDLDFVKIPQLYLFEGEKAGYLHNGRTGTGIFIDAQIADSVKRGSYSDDLLGKLLSRGMIETPARVVPDTEKGPSFFLIDMTQGCNFNCCYCLRNPESEGLKISFEMLDRILDRIILDCRQHQKKKISIQPWGGEPLLELEKVLYIRTKMSRDAADLDVNITLETNGSKITDEVAAKLRAAKIGVGISIDGPREIHDRQRRDTGGHATFDQVMAGIGALRKSGMEHMGTITVVTRDSMKQMEEILGFFAEEMPEFSVKLNPMHSPGKKEAVPLAIQEDDMREYMHRLVTGTEKLWKAGKKIREGNLITALQNLLIRSDRDLCHSRGCRGGSGMIIFDQKGRIFPCEIVDYPEEQLGTVDDGTDILERVLEGKKKNEYFKTKHKPECDSCPWWYYCRGGCTSALLYQKGCVEGVDECGCAGVKALYEEVVRMLLDDPDLAWDMAGIHQLTVV